MKTERFMEMMEELGLSHVHDVQFIEGLAQEVVCELRCPVNRWVAKQNRTIRNSREHCGLTTGDLR